MNLRLPPPQHGQLPRSPLTLVVCQVKYETIMAVSDAKTALAFHNALGGGDGPYSRPEPAALRSMTVELDAQSGAMKTSPATQQLNGWRMVGQDGSWLVSLMPDFVALETTGAYSSWEGFRKRLSEVLDATCSVLAPDTEQRIGLRYVDQLTKPEVHSVSEWSKYVHPSLLGLSRHDALGSAVTKAQSQFEIQPNPELSCVVRSASFPDDARPGCQAFVLDTDVFREGLRSFRANDILEVADSFHVFALQVFQQSVTESLLDLLKEPREAAS